MQVIDTVRETIREQGLIETGDTVLVGLSGGPDSVCMLHILYTLRQELELTLCAVHVNHGIRGEAAEADQAYAQRLCSRLNVPLAVYFYDIPSIAEEQCISTEDAGRRMRYQAFFEEKKKRGAQSIAVAHNQNDQAETVLMRIMRGTGVNGLGGMEYKRQDGVIRPVLDLTRREIEGYCEKHQLEPCVDKTNLEPVYTRNRIRLELIPYMQQQFNPGVISALCRLASIAREESSLIDNILSDALESHLKPGEKDDWYLSADILRNMKPALRKRAVQHIFEIMGLQQNLGFVHLSQAERLIEATETAESRTAEFPRGFRMVRKGNLLHFFQISQSLTQNSESNGVLKEKLLKNDGTTDWKSLPDNVRCFDYSVVKKTGLPIVLRTRKPGDFIQPLGMQGRKKLQDYFVDKKIPKESRDDIPLVCLGREVIWIIGGQISEAYKVTRQSESILSLEFHHRV